MNRLSTALLCMAVSAVGVSAAWAQTTTAGITGVARDTSGAVVPGVTVEAASPALIEKVRVAVTDGQGRYNFVDLRPGTYSVTFALPGFATVKVEGVQISGGFTATANADMKVGGIEETLTVTGTSPIVDAQNVRTQQVFKQDVLDALPSGAKDLTQLASLTLGATTRGNSVNDVGGNLAEVASVIAIHGSRSEDARANYDGMSTNVSCGGGGGVARIWKFNVIAVEETVIDTGGSSAEIETSGANVNMIPRDGGNRFTVRSIVNYTNEQLSSGKVPDSLIARGSAPDQNSMKKVYDYGLGIGGPIMRDRLWFYSANRVWGNQAYGANSYFNKSPVFYRYEPDLSRPAYTDNKYRDFGGRLTWQASPRHKFTLSEHGQVGCNCWLAIATGSTSSPEATNSFYYNGPGGPMWLTQPGWSFPVTNQLLIQVKGSFLLQGFKYTNDDVPGPNDVSILEQTTGVRWGALPGSVNNSYFPLQRNDNFGQDASISYITGTHTFRTGFQTRQGKNDTYGDALPNGVNYTFRNGVPISIAQFGSPFENHVRTRSLGIFAQDRWTLDRMTLNLGVRFDHVRAYTLAYTIPAGPFVGARSFDGIDDYPNFSDITPRIGVAYDVFGNGKTAIKGSWGRYLVAVGAQDARNFSPAQSIITSTTRQWNDTNGNFVPDCDLKNLGINGECGAVANSAFGQTTTPATVWDPSARNGWNTREYNYQSVFSVQHEVRQGLGLTANFANTRFRNQQVVVNQAQPRSTQTSYCITAPTDARLAEFSGRRICGLFDPNPNVVGQINGVRMLAKNVPGATKVPGEIFNGLDVAMNARFGSGGMVMGGFAIGRTTFDTCWMNDLPNVSLVNARSSNVLGSNYPGTDGYCNIISPLWNGTGSQIKFQAVYPLPRGFVVSGTLKNLPGVPVSASYPVTNAQIRPELGRDLSACRGLVGPACTQTVTVQLLPRINNLDSSSAAVYDQRLNETDVRLSRAFQIGRRRVLGTFDLYNVFNNRPVQSSNGTYGASWQRPTQILGGRLAKFGVQVDF